ncbi:unnamed protein product [Wuchereria bancrofti]|uniref:G-protein coupled receptors family 1 profile domain-containing protein n=1 Tax=Wuchereria bancrofti TaxID=6293 RepID=A0A3P7F1Y9_WUCBA|nr:unnamed protein product [Wuchereria bancrofti]
MKIPLVSIVVNAINVYLDLIIIANGLTIALVRLFLLLVLSVCLISTLISTCLLIVIVISFISIGLLPHADKLPIKLLLWQGLCFAVCILYSTVAIMCAHLLYFHYKLC